MKFFGIIIVSALLFLGLDYLANKKIDFYANMAAQSPKVDWIIVLGNGPGLTQALRLRLDNAILAHQLWPTARILLTGDESAKEVSVMKEYLVNQGLPKEFLVEESESTSTWNSFENLKKIIGKEDIALIITNEFHQRRSMATAALMGYNAALFGKDTVPLERQAFYATRERMGVIKWYLQSLLYKRYL